MSELSNKTLIALVMVALFAAVAGTLVTFGGGITGFATNGTGIVNLTINDTLAIQVDPNNSTINFGTCAPRPGSSYWCSSNDTAECDTTSVWNCTGDTTAPQFIRVDNVGNADANINVSSECDASSFIGGSSPLFQFVTTHCNGTNVTSWTSFPLDPSSTQVCSNLSYVNGMMRLYVNITVPQDATGGSGACTDGQSTVTFSATLA